MTAKEYLNQARHLDALIHCRLREIDYWRDLSISVSSSGYEEHHNPNRPTDAPFVRCLEKIDEIQQRWRTWWNLRKKLTLRLISWKTVTNSCCSVIAIWIIAVGRRYPI